MTLHLASASLSTRYRFLLNTTVVMVSSVFSNQLYCVLVCCRPAVEQFMALLVQTWIFSDNEGAAVTTVCRKNRLLCQQLLWLCEQKSRPTLMHASVLQWPHPIITILMWHFVLFVVIFSKRMMRVCVAESKSLQARTSGWKILEKRWLTGFMFTHRGSCTAVC